MFQFFIQTQYCFNYLINQISPSLLFYAHIPTSIIAMIFGFFILSNSKTSEGKTLFKVCGLYTLWSLLSITTWFSFLGSQITMFTWSLIDLVSLLLFFNSYNFLYQFTKKNELPTWQKIISIFLILPTAIWTFFGSNLIYYDANTCESVQNEQITLYPYFVQMVFILMVIFLIIRNLIKTQDKEKKKEFFLAGIGVTLFLSFFFGATFLVNYLINNNIWVNAYNLEIYGLFGMPILLIYLGFLIVKFKEFNIKAFGAQALIIALIALIGSQFFYVSDLPSIILTSVTLVVTGVIGINLMRSVKKEVDLRERIEKTEKDLEVANSHLKELDVQKTEFISFATHQLRGPLTAVKGYASLLIEGDYGEMTSQVKDAIKIIYESTQSLLLIVGDYLNVSRMEQGRMKYDVAEFDLKTLVEDTVKELGPNLSYAGLTLNFESPKDSFMISADRGKIKEVISNLIDNATKYTKKGGISITLEKVDRDRCRLKVKDTGIGIPPEVMPKLFEKFSRAPDASKTNIMGTGLGLFVAKAIIEQHKGRIWAESEGSGKGSTFIVELRLVGSDAHVPEALKKFAEGL